MCGIYTSVSWGQWGGDISDTYSPLVIICVQFISILNILLLEGRISQQRRRRYLVITCLSYHWYSHCNARVCREMLSIVIIYKDFFLVSNENLMHNGSILTPSPLFVITLYYVHVSYSKLHHLKYEIQHTSTNLWQIL